MLCDSGCIYRGEDMQDGVNVPALGGRIPDRDTHTHTHTHSEVIQANVQRHYDKTRARRVAVKRLPSQRLQSWPPEGDRRTHGDMFRHKDC